MKSALLLSALLALPGIYGQTAESTIRDLDTAWGKAIVAKDAAKLDRLLDEGLIYGHASGVVDTKKSYLDKIRSGKQVYASLNQYKVTVRILEGGSGALTHSWLHVTGVNPAGPFDDKVMLLHVWSKRGGEWKLIAHQTAKVDSIPK